MRASVPFLLVVLAVTAPSVQAGTLENPEGSVPAAWYIHLAGLQDAPIHPVPPPLDHTASVTGGVLTNSATCVPLPPLAGMQGAWHVYYAYPTLDAVDYRDGEARFSAQRGLVGDIVYDTAAAFTVHYYLESHGPVPPADALPAVVPQAVVQATLRTGSEVGAGDEPFNTGDVVARGRTAPAMLSPLLDGHPQVEHMSADGRDVYHFAVPMVFEQAEIPAEDSFNLRIDVFIDNPLCDEPQHPSDEMLMPNSLRPHSSPEARPRLESVLERGPRLADFRAEPWPDGTVRLSALVDAPWLVADHGSGPPVVEIRGGGGAWTLEPAFVSGFGTGRDGYHCHCYGENHRQEYVWNRTAAEAPDGPYTAAIVVPLGDGRNATASVDFDTRGGYEAVTLEGIQILAEADIAEAPAWPVAGLAAAVFLAALVRRRRA